MHLLESLLRPVGRAIAEHDLIAHGDHIMVAMSGGKDSYALLLALRALQRRAPVQFKLTAVHLDQRAPGHDSTPLERWLQKEEIPFKVVREDTFSIVREKIPEGEVRCPMCARLRRAILYRTASELACNKLALGHHRDDAVETLLLNVFFSGKLASMPPKLVSDDGQHVVIRPLIYCAEPDLAAVAAAHGCPILPCRICSEQRDSQRREMKELLNQMEKRWPNVRSSMLAALGNVVPSHLLDPKLRHPSS